MAAVCDLVDGLVPFSANDTVLPDIGLVCDRHRSRCRYLLTIPADVSRLPAGFTTTFLPPDFTGMSSGFVSEEDGRSTVVESSLRLRRCLMYGIIAAGSFRLFRLSFVSAVGTVRRSTVTFLLAA